MVPIRVLALVTAAAFLGPIGCNRVSAPSDNRDASATDNKAPVDTKVAEKPRADDPFTRGTFALMTGLYDKAIPAFSEAIRLNPKDVEAYSSRGLCYMAKGDPEKAEKDFDEAIRLDSKYGKAFKHRAALRESKGDFDKAVADYNQVILLEKNAADAYKGRGRAHAKKNGFDDHEKAVADFTEAIRLNSKDAEVYIYRADSYINLVQADKAIADCTEAIRLNPKYAKAYEKRGVAYLLKSDIGKARADAAKAQELDPSLVPQSAQPASAGQHWSQKLTKEQLIEKCNTLLGKPDHAGGLKVPKELLQKDPHLVYLCLVSQSMNAKERQEWLDLLPKMKPQQVEEFRSIELNALKAFERLDAEDALKQARSFLDQKKYAEAIPLLTLAASQTYLQPGAYRLRAYAHSLQKDYKNAIADYSKAVELAPDSPTALNGLAWFLATCPDGSFRKSKEAITHATKACQVTEWKNPFYLDTLAAGYAADGQFKEAIQWQEKALAHPEFPKMVSEGELAKARARLELYKQQKPYVGE